MRDHKSSRFSVRLSPDEDRHLHQLANQWHVKRSMAVRLLIQHTMPIPPKFRPVGIFTPVGENRLQPIVIGGNSELL